MEDTGRKSRRKSRRIVEIKYPAVPAFFDHRGEFIQKIQEFLGQRYPHWRSDTDAAVFVDDAEKPSRQFQIGYNRTILVSDKLQDRDDFEKESLELIELAHEHLLRRVEILLRVGVRIFGVYVVDRHLTMKSATDLAIEKFHLLSPKLKKEYTDSVIRLVHTKGSFQFGPVQKGESWIKQAFGDSDTDMPAIGFGLDVDSYESMIEARGFHSICECVTKLLSAGSTTEDAILEQAGIVNVK